MMFYGKEILPIEICSELFLLTLLLFASHYIHPSKHQKQPDLIKNCLVPAGILPSEQTQETYVILTYMEIGIDSFAAMISGNSSKAISDSDALTQLLDRIEHADLAGLDVFGIGEHHRKGFLDAAPTLILAAPPPVQSISVLQVRLRCLVQLTP